MIELVFDVEDIARTRFAISPLWEAVTSLRTLATGSSNGWHRPWLRHLPGRLGEVDLPLLTAVVRPAGYLPDFLLPPPSVRPPDLESELAAIAATPPQLVTQELTHLAEHPLAQNGPGRAERVMLVRTLAADPCAARERLVKELRRYWEAALAPHWARIRAVLADDIDHRLAELADGGVNQLFRTLHPRVSFRRDTLRIVKYYKGRVRLHCRGLVLVPCAFCSPDVIVRTADPRPVLAYPPRGIARLWLSKATGGESPLPDVLGNSRAAILERLSVPMSTTRLAAELKLTPATVSSHLKALSAAGILASTRDGRSVLYRRTRLGELLYLTNNP